MLIALVGPTGVGKTKLSIALAKKYNAYIINFDSVQIYKGLNIGSAKVTESEMEGIKHFLLDIRKPDEYYSVSDYQKDARTLIEKYKDHNIILVGGTGLYLCATIMDYHFEDDNSNNDYEMLSNEQLYEMALKKDKTCNIHPNNRVRLIRFLNRKNTTIYNPTLLYKDIKIIGLKTDRDTLYNNVDKRVDKMISNGLVNEVKELYSKYPKSRVLNAAIGYKEIIDYLNGLCSYEEAINNIKKNSRHYVKRQFTWFNNKMNVTWFNTDYDNFDNTINEVINYIEK